MDALAIVVVGLSFGLVALLLGGLILVVRDTIRGRGRWGMNFKLPVCRKCGNPPSAVRIPRTTNEMLWGGWTCSECGYELDKWGEPLPNQTRPAKWKAMEAMEAAEEPRPKRAKRRDDRYRGESDA